MALPVPIDVVALGPIAYLWSNRYSTLNVALFLFSAVFGWFSDPSVLLSVVSSILTFMIENLEAFFLSTEADEAGVKAVFLVVKGIVSDEAWVDAWAVVLYMASPGIPPAVLAWCVKTIVLLWGVMMVLRVVLWLKGHIWSSSN